MSEPAEMRLSRSPVTVLTLAIATLLSVAQFAKLDVSWAWPDDLAIWNGQLWRLLTSVFLHVNFIHLIFNLYWVKAFGPLIEEWLGSIRTLLLVGVLAISSSAMEFLISESGIGLSGVVYGFFGLFYAVRGSTVGPRAKLSDKTIRLFIGWFFVCIVLTYTHVMAIGNTAHATGAVVGYLIGKAMLTGRGRAWMGVVGLATALLAGATLYMPWNYRWWWHNGDRALRGHDEARARACWSQAVAIAPNDREVEGLLVDLAQYAAEDGRYEEADALLRRAEGVTIQPETIRAWQAYNSWSRGDRQRAAQELRGVRAVDIDDSLKQIAPFFEFTQQVAKGTWLSTRPESEPAS